MRTLVQALWMVIQPDPKVRCVMPDMKDQLAKLFELQQTDIAIGGRRQALRELDDGAAATAELEAAKSALANQEAELHHLQATLKDRELQLRSTEDEHKARSRQAYGGTVHDPKQLAALEKKIEELGRHKDRLEEEILELMEQVEAVQRAVEKQRAVVADLSVRADGIKERFAAGSEKLKAELKELRRHREELVAQLDPPLLRQYEDLLEKAHGLAVAAVRRGCCSGCKVTVPSLYAPRLRSRDQMVKCENCRRILYLPEGESAFKPEEDR